MTRHEPCACGGLITAREGREASAVYAHTEEERHRAWREAGGMELDAPNFDVHVASEGADAGPRPAERPEPLTWDPAGPQQALAAALASQDVVGVLPAGWVYRDGRRVSRVAVVAAGGS